MVGAIGGSVLGRLKALKGASKKREVDLEPDYLEDEEEAEDLDLSGTNSNAPMAQEANEPQLEMGGELNPQSYDVRANEVNIPQKTEQKEKHPIRAGWATNLHQWGGNKEVTPQTPPIETQQVEMEEGIAPVSASQEVSAEEKKPGVLSRLGTWLKSQASTPEEIQERISKMPHNIEGGDKEQQRRDYLEYEDLKEKGLEPDVVQAEQQDEFNASIERAMEQPWEYSVYGSGEKVQNDPIMEAQFKEITGMDLTPEMAEQEKTYEKAMDGVEKALNGQPDGLDALEKTILDRILNNQTTDADKFYIGLALLMPLIVGGMFGKEAGFGALGGTAEGFANVLQNREKMKRTDEAALADLYKIRAAIQKEGKEKPSHLEGRNIIKFYNPETKQNENAVEILPGFYTNQKYLGTKEDISEVRKHANELAEVKSYVDEIDDLSTDIIEIASQLKDKDIVRKIFINKIEGKNPGALSYTSQDVDFNGRKVNAGLILNEKLGFLATAYSQAKQLGQLDRAAQAHIEKIMLNPEKTLASGKDSIDQMIEVRKFAQKGLVQRAKNKGFYPQPLQKEIDERNQKLYSRLNKKEQAKRVEKTKTTAARTGTTYAK